jgi:hypothetical protein
MDPDTATEGEPCQADGANIVIKTKRPRSEGQKLSLSKAQAARKEKSAARREEKQEAVAVEEPKKDYKLLYKLQKQSLSELRFEKAVNDKIIETMRAREEKPKAEPVTETKQDAPAVSVRGGWLTAGPIPRKKNPMHHW